MERETTYNIEKKLAAVIWNYVLESENEIDDKKQH